RARGLQIGERSDQIVLRLHKFAGLDLEEGRTGLNMIAELGDQIDDSSGEGRKDWCGQIVIERDIAFRHLLGTKADEANRLDLEPGQLGRRRPESAWHRLCRLRGLLDVRLDEFWGNSKAEHDERRGNGEDRQLPPAREGVL